MHNIDVWKHKKQCNEPIVIHCFNYSISCISNIHTYPQLTNNCAWLMLLHCSTVEIDCIFCCISASIQYIIMSVCVWAFVESCMQINASDDDEMRQERMQGFIQNYSVLLNVDDSSYPFLFVSHRYKALSVTLLLKRTFSCIVNSYRKDNELVILYLIADAW